jgi:threonine dehydrogenase-like Zn-dependent dehydrogenase
MKSWLAPTQKHDGFMRALIIDRELRLANDLPIPQPRKDQALLKIRRAGICNTDLELLAGYRDFSGILGHEFVAEVIEGPANLLGRRVVGEINVVCGECEFCRSGVPSQCRNRKAVGIFNHPGAFADFLCLESRNLHIVSEQISDDAAVFVEPLAAALQVLEAVHISPRDRVVVMGAGKLGLLVAQVLRLTGADVVVVVRYEKQSRFLKEWGIASAAHADLPGASADVVVDCTGTADGFSESLDLVKPRATIVLKSTYAGWPDADLTRVAVNEIRIVGSRCGPFDAALRILAGEMVDVETLIEAHYDLDQGVQAINHAARKGALKVLLDI